MEIWTKVEDSKSEADEEFVMARKKNCNICGKPNSIKIKQIYEDLEIRKIACSCGFRLVCYINKTVGNMV